MYLLDTNVVSELRKVKSLNINKKADENVVAWSSSVTATSLYISVITILELETGTLLIERRDPVQVLPPVQTRSYLPQNAAY